MKRTPEQLWLPRADWKRGGQDTAPYIRASWVSDAWQGGERYVRADIAKAELDEAHEQIAALTSQRDAALEAAAHLAEKLRDVLNELSAAVRWMSNLPTDDQLDRKAHGERHTGRQLLSRMVAAIKGEL